MHSPAYLLIPWLGLALARSPKHADTGEVPDPPTLRVLSPTPDAWFDEGDKVLFSVEGRGSSGAGAEVSAVTWTSEPWIGSGAEVSTTELPAGIIDFTVEGIVEETTCTESFSITVWAPETTTP